MTLARTALRGLSAARALPAPAVPALRIQRRALSALEGPPKYITTAIASGEGRNGHIELEHDLKMPKELGGPGGGANPEQMFALGYSACFLSALQLVAREGKVKIPSGVKVKATVKIGASAGKPGFALAVDIAVSGLDAETGRDLVKQAHAACPYSRMAESGIVATAKAV